MFLPCPFHCFCLYSVVCCMPESLAHRGAAVAIGSHDGRAGKCIPVPQVDESISMQKWNSHQDGHIHHTEAAIGPSNDYGAAVFSSIICIIVINLLFVASLNSAGDCMHFLVACVLCTVECCRLLKSVRCQLYSRWSVR